MDDCGVIHASKSNWKIYLKNFLGKISPIVQGEHLDPAGSAHLREAPVNFSDEKVIAV